ncbi:MAG TPA: phage integrase SAM-like domain-containing protein, partial [Planctomycetaceae bacterium]|nr:phage integrase SAM-like domain-containing protein [Planctomycetaceae bacterium]
YDLSGRRSAIHVGKISMPSARALAGHVQHLVVCRKSGTDYRRSTTDWVERIRQDWPNLASRLGEFGLIAFKVWSDPSFTDFAESLIACRSDVKPNTVKAWKQTAEKVRLFFGNRTIRSLTAKDGSDFLRWLNSPVEHGGAGHTASTPSKHLTIAKGFLNEAVDAEILAGNPFQKVKGDRTVDKRRRRFITVEQIDSVISSTEDVELRAVIALSRWGGLRTPSEPFALEWSHIDWQRLRITVPAVKTKLRELPLFPELVPYLKALHESGVQNLFVFPRLRQFTDANLRKQMSRLIRRSGMTVWPKLFQNIRSSRQTELEERFPRKTVCAWMGNSETVADQHYLQVLDEHFDRAVVGESAAVWLHC